MYKDLAHTIVHLAAEKHVMLATAESCTGGMIAAALTDIAGSSRVFDRGFVTYSNDAKQDMLGVTSETLATFGAVSSATAKEMAFGALSNSRADIAVSVTGIAGPSGGTPDKPVGLVWFGIAQIGVPPHAWREDFGNIGRGLVRQKTVWTAINALHQAIKTF